MGPPKERQPRRRKARKTSNGEPGLECGVEGIGLGEVYDRVVIGGFRKLPIELRDGLRVCD